MICVCLIYDPEAMDECKRRIGNKVEYAWDMYDAAVDADALTVLEATKSGFVRKVNVFGTVVTGETFAQTLSLGTTNFHIDQVEEGYRIISIGKGSSLGMSMYGAGWKADQGSTYREIITYYYPETSIADGAAY